MKIRIEEDRLGKRDIPHDAYWGIHTLRAVENFALSGRTVQPVFIRALAMVKRAACLTNHELGFYREPIADALVQACNEIEAGGLADQFPVDALQGGAGTSLNMNMNEVLANRALEICGHALGSYDVIHPLAQVNLHQSTNDVVPTALHIAAIQGVRNVSRGAEALQDACQLKEREFAGMVKVGRTEMVPAVPITLGAEFSAFADAFARDRWRTFKCEERLRTVNLGGTAVGTGMAAPRDYIFIVIEKLREISGLGLARADNLMDGTANSDALVEVSGIFKAYARNLIKIAGDLRLLAALGHIVLPTLQTGSSIMPGKVNPVVCEAVIQAGLAVLADDMLVTEASSRATLQIGEFLPLLADALLHALDILDKAGFMLASYIARIEAAPEVCAAELDTSAALLTPFIPKIGYEGALALLDAFEENGTGTLRAYIEKELGVQTVQEALAPERITAMGYR